MRRKCSARRGGTRAGYRDSAITNIARRWIRRTAASASGQQSRNKNGRSHERRTWGIQFHRPAFMGFYTMARIVSCTASNWALAALPPFIKFSPQVFVYLVDPTLPMSCVDSRSTALEKEQDLPCCHPHPVISSPDFGHHGDTVQKDPREKSRSQSCAQYW